MDTLIGQLVHFLQKFADVQGYAVADNIGDMIVKDAGGKLMQGETAVIVDDGVVSVAAALKTDDHIRLRGQHIGDFSLALVAPVGAYDCLYHEKPPAFVGDG